MHSPERSAEPSQASSRRSAQREGSSERSAGPPQASSRRSAQREGSSEPAGKRVLIAGGGPAGLALALMLARRGVASTVLDARPLAAARADSRLLALSRGTLQMLRPLVQLQPETMAAIHSVVVSSAGEFGRVRIGTDDVARGAAADEPLGVTVRYGDLLLPLAQACDASALVTVRRPCRVIAVRQQPQQVLADIEAADADDDAALAGSLLVHAEGGADGRLAGAAAGFAQVAVLADVAVEGIAPGCAHERFTRDGPLALLPAPATAAAGGGARNLSLVWCMPPAQAQRRLALADADFLAELQQAIGLHNGRVQRVGRRASHALQSHARGTLHQHRVVWVGNAAQSLHPVAGQGLNLGLRDCTELAGLIGQAVADGRDPGTVLGDYARRRRTDRTALIALTRNAPALFASRAAPLALGRSLALSALSMIPELRREFARLLMFGVRV